MHFKKWILVIPFALSVLTGCSIAEKLVYRIDVNQGNYIEQPQVEQLRYGMTKEQVRYVMGSPMLVEYGYPDTWYYIYNSTKGHDDTVQKKLVAHFDPASGLLGQIDGDFEPSPNFMTPLQ